MAFRSLILILYASIAVHAVTVYNQLPLGAQTTSITGSAAGAQFTGNAAYNPTTLTPPPIPNPPPPNQIPVVLMPTADLVPGIGIETPGTFFGFSIEMSVANQVLGSSSKFINVPFLNFASRVLERAGGLVVRVGGNTQDYATLVDSTPDGKMLGKVSTDPNNPTDTPTLVFTDELLYLMSNISTLVPIKWFLGVPFNNTEDIHIEIVEHGQRIIGDNLLGFQVGNEPDLYAQHLHRPSTYSANDYYTEFGEWLDVWNSDPNIPDKQTMIGPSLASIWPLEDVWNTPFITNYTNNLYALSVERYPMDNCAALYPGLGAPVVPQDVFPAYLNHGSGKGIISSMLNSTMVAQTAQKPFIMFETNSASCGGFAGISNVFGISLWALDYGLQMAYSNFTHALVHFGGQNVYYNPFTPPPTNESTYHQWTVGPIFYSLMIMPEILGRSNTARVMDLTTNDLTPVYAIYENNQLARVALVNYMDDLGTGNNAYTATISVGGGETGQPGTTPASVQVKYLLADSVSELFNITWAGQTFGGRYESNGILQGDEQVQTVQCDTTAGTCSIRVPAPGFALVMMSEAAASESEPTATQTFPTTALTKTVNTATIESAVLETSNGHGGKDRAFGSTSKGSSGAGKVTGVAPGMMAVLSVLSGVYLLLKAFS